MAEITEERLRKIVGTPLSLAPAVCNYVDAWYFAAELLAARAQVERLRGVICEYVKAIDGLAVDDSAEAQNLYERAEDALREVARG